MLPDDDKRPVLLSHIYFRILWRHRQLVYCPTTPFVDRGLRKLFMKQGPRVAQWLRHCATSRAVPGSNPGGVGHRDFSRGYRQNHVPWGQLSL